MELLVGSESRVVAMEVGIRQGVCNDRLHDLQYQARHHLLKRSMKSTCTLMKTYLNHDVEGSFEMQKI